MALTAVAVWPFSFNALCLYGYSVLRANALDNRQCLWGRPSGNWRQGHIAGDTNRGRENEALIPRVSSVVWNRFISISSRPSTANGSTAARPSDLRTGGAPLQLVRVLHRRQSGRRLE